MAHQERVIMDDFILRCPAFEKEKDFPKYVFLNKMHSHQNESKYIQITCTPIQRKKALYIFFLQPNQSLQTLHPPIFVIADLSFLKPI